MNDTQSVFEDRFYRMDPEVDEVLFDGTYIRNGMVILIEDPDNRSTFDVSEIPGNPIVENDLRLKNRWCTVEKIKITHDGEVVQFVGVYADGERRKRMYQTVVGWLAKKNSIPVVVNQIADLVPKFYEMNPLEDTIIREGTSLMNGMRVLLEESDRRKAVYPDMNDYSLAEARIKNRWCVVRYFRVKEGGRSISFVGEYDDGVKVTRTALVAGSWLVKIDSIPTTP